MGQRGASAMDFAGHARALLLTLTILLLLTPSVVAGSHHGAPRATPLPPQAVGPPATSPAWGHAPPLTAPAPSSPPGSSAHGGSSRSTAHPHQATSPTTQDVTALQAAPSKAPDATAAPPAAAPAATGATHTVPVAPVAMRPAGPGNATRGSAAGAAALAPVPLDLVPVAAAFAAVVGLGAVLARRPRHRPLNPRGVGGYSGLLLLGHDAADHRDHDAALRWFETAIALRPQEPVAHTCLGITLLGMGRSEAAGEALGHAVQLDPVDPVPRFHLARALVLQHRNHEALVHLRPLIAGRPELAAEVLEDPAFRSLWDDPRFLVLAGRL